MATQILASSGSTRGLVATSTTAGGANAYVEAIQASTDGDRNVIVATNASTGGYPAIYARNTASSGTNFGIYGVSDSTSGRAVSGIANAYQGNSAVGVYGQADHGTGVKGTGFIAGVHGVAVALNGAIGVYGQGASGADAAVWANANGATYGVYSGGSCLVTGWLSKGAGSFLIDHPLDPENKYLRHSFVESPDMKNVYDGVVTADDRGEASIDMPAYFEVLNSDFRYQLTPLGGAAPNLHVRKELPGGGFSIAGASPGQRISWQVTGIRKDPFALAHPMLVEEAKPANEVGFYLHPEVYGKPPSKGLDHSRLAAVHSTPDEPAKVSGA